MEASSLPSSTTSKTLHLTQFPSIIPNKLTIIPTRKSFPVANYSNPPDHCNDHDHDHEITQSLDKVTKPIVLKLSFKKPNKSPENPDKAGEARNASLSSPCYDEWSEWERKLFKPYYDDAFEAMELLRLYLMRTRPSVAMGVLALVAVAVPVTTPAALSSALKVARELLEGGRVCIDIDFL